MNKKLIAIIAVIVITVTAICLITLKGKDEPEVTTTVEGQPITVNLESETTEKPLFSPSFNKTTVVVLPIEFVDAQYRDDLKAFAEAKGYYSIQKKGDTHVKIRMREYSYRLLLTSIGMETVSGIGYAMDSGDYPFIIDFAKYNSNFSDIVFTVDKEKYEKAKNKDEFFELMAVYCFYYQDYDNDSEGKCKITLCEKDTNILIETREITKADLTGQMQSE